MILLAAVTWTAALAQAPGRPEALAAFTLKPARVFDGEAMHEGWAVRVEGERIEAAGPAAGVDTAGAKVVDLPGATLLPGLVEGHSHMLLHPYNETTWNDQVLREGLALRAARAVNHLRATLMAGFTTIRDLGTEGAGYADVELKQAVNEGIIPGPRMLVVTRAIVATGELRSQGLRAGVARAAGRRGGRWRSKLVRVVRDQIGHGADWIKLYGDYRWGPLRGIASDLLAGGDDTGRGDGHGAPACRCPSTPSTPEGMRRAVLAGAETDRARRRRHAGDLQADGRASRGALPDARRQRGHRPVRRLEAKGQPEPPAHRAQARQLQGGARMPA